MKAIPNSLRPDPYRPKRVAVDPGPVSFRTAVHRVLASADPKRPPTVETNHRETPLTAPGTLVQATDRDYVVTEAGPILRAWIPVGWRRARRDAPSKAEAKARAKSAERIEDAIANADRRRRERAAKRKAGYGQK